MNQALKTHPIKRMIKKITTKLGTRYLQSASLRENMRSLQPKEYPPCSLSHCLLVIVQVPAKNPTKRTRTQKCGTRILEIQAGDTLPEEACLLWEAGEAGVTIPQTFHRKPSRLNLHPAPSSTGRVMRTEKRTLTWIPLHSTR